MKADLYGELFLWNGNLDRLIRVLQRMETLSIRPKQEMKAFEVRLEEICAALNADFTESMATRERSDQSRLTRQRTGWEEKTVDENTTDPQHFEQSLVCTVIGRPCSRQPITTAALAASAFRMPTERTRLPPTHTLFLCALRRKEMAKQWVNGKHNSACGSGKVCELNLRSLLPGRNESSAILES